MNKKKRLEELVRTRVSLGLNNLQQLLSQGKLDINNLAKELKDLANYTEESLTLLEDKKEEKIIPFSKDKKDKKK